MKLALELSQSGRGASVNPTSSLTHFWARDDMTFNGSNVLTGIVDQVAASSAYIGIVGSPGGSVADGIAITEATGAANYVSIDGIIETLSAPGTHIAIAFKRNATVDDRCAILQATNSQARQFYARDAITAAAEASLITTMCRVDEVDIGAAANQDQVWDACFGDTTARAVLLENAACTFDTSPTWRVLSDANATENFEGHIIGFAAFTDWDQADAIAAALIAGAP